MRSSTVRSGSQSADDRRSVISGNSSTASTLIADSLASGKTATSQLRKFTAGVGRPGLAREARDAVRLALVAQNPLRKAPISEPVDYEKFINERSIQLENDAQREIVLFPRDDIEESSAPQECETAIPMVKPTDIKQAKWLLTREALRFYTSPHRSIVFNYSKFSGDYSANNTSSSIESETLSSLVFESDMAIEENKASFEMAHGAVGIVKEGPLNVLKSDNPTLFDNLKSSTSKKRFCVLRRLESGDCAFEIRKTSTETPKMPAMKCTAAQIKSTKKGKTVLEIRGGNDEKTTILLECEDTSLLEEWLVALQTAIAFASKEDALSICSELDNKGKSAELPATSSGSSTVTGRSTAPDTESIGSEDSSNSRTSEMAPWRGRNSAARALQPPIVERRNMFSLYYRLQPLPESQFDSSTINQRKRVEKEIFSSSSSPVKMRKSSSLLKKISPAPSPVLVSIDFQGLTLKLPTMGVTSNLIAHQQIEPFFLRFFVFDALEARRCCEEFQILCNGDELHVSEPVFDSSCQVNGIRRSLLVERSASRALLHLPPNCLTNQRDLWIVCRVDRVLSADTQADLYMKSSNDPKSVAKLQKTIASSMTRLTGHRQRFAWTARPLFPELRADPGSTTSSSSQISSSPWARGSLDTLPLFRCETNRFAETDLQKNLMEFNKLEKQTKMMVPNATVTVSINTRANVIDYLNRVNPSLYPLNPWKPESSPPVFQLQTFGDQPLEPHSTLTNLLYIYPLSLKYDSQKAFSKARNISCTVRFVRGDEAIPEKAMVDRMSPAGPYCISATCAVQHHHQNPVFGEEMKAQLPLNLTTSDHLLFSFSHISVAGTSSLKSSDSVETPIGYAWLPLVWKKERLVMESDEQEFALPIAIDLPPHYYQSKPTGMVGGKTDEPLSEVRWVDQKPLFRVRLRLVSSVFTTDSKLQTFFQACDRLSAKGIIGDAADSSLKRMVKSKSSSPPSSTDLPRSCSPIADSMHRSLSLEDPDQNPHMKHLLQSIRLLSDVPFDRLFVYLPIVLGRLFAILPQAPTEQLAISTLRAIIQICDSCCQNGKPHVVRRFVKSHFGVVVKDQFVAHEQTIYSAICRNLPILMRELNSEPDQLAQLYRQLWVLVDAVVKSMAQTMCTEQLNKIAQKDRFPTELLDQMGQVLEVGVPQIVAKHKEMKEESRCANLALAYLTRFAMSFVDRGVVFRWIHFYVSRFDDTDFRALRDYKTDLLEILCLHEHHVPLNLPVLINSSAQIQRLNYSGGVIDSQMQTTNASGHGFLSRFFNQIFNTPTIETSETDRYASCSGEWHLSPQFAQNHFIVGLLMQEMVACIRETKDYRKRPISLLRNLLAKHSFDRRYTDMTIQRRIAMLYAPVLTFALDHLHEFESESDFDDVDATPTTGYRTFSHPPQNPSTPKSKWRTLSSQRYATESPQFSRGSPIRTSSPTLSSRPPQMPPPPPMAKSTNPPPPTSSTPLVEKLTEDEIQDILICCVFILQRMPKRILAALWTENDGANAEKMLRLLELIVEVFRYRGKEHALRKTAANSKTRSLFTLNLPARLSTNTNRMSTEMESEDPNASGATNSVPFRVLQLVNLSQEVSLIVLDVAQTFAHQLATSATTSKSHRHQNPNWESHFHGLLALHLRLADENCSESVRLHVIAALALFVNLFRVRLFEGGPLEPLYMLIEKVLIQMASRLPAVQAAAAALLQLILRNGYEVAQGYYASQILAQSVSPASSKMGQQKKGVSSERLGRPGSQTGVALARLLGFQSVLSNSAAFERGLAAVESLVDTRKATTFDLAVLDLLRQLRGVMTATVALKDAANDPIRLADLHLQLADSYRGSAALRSAWFDTLAELYEQDRWFAEASVCHAHSVAIIARELEEKKEIEVDWRIFDWINAGIAGTEQTQSGDVQPAGFTAENLGTKIDKTAAALMLAERFEAVGPLYRLIVPVLERNMNFTSLVSVYAELQQTYSRAAEVRSSGKRHLGTYFRVRFYGENHFKNEHNTDWIYREAGLTSLAAFALEIKEKCQRQVGHDRVQIEANEQLDVSKIDATVAYVQITHVEPSGASSDSASQAISNNDFLLHTNLSEFSYECAMIENDRKLSREPAIHEQILKRTILRVAGGANGFPSTRRRLPVASVHFEQFSPLEFACQKLNTKAEQIRRTLNAAANGRRLDVKGLQLLLQGAVLPTVNAGPLAYAEVFTKEEQKSKYGEESIQKLRESFRNLMNACQLAIEANASAIASDQHTYHEVLVSSFDAMHERLQTFFGSSLRESPEPDGTSDLPRSAIHILDMMGGVRN